MHIGLIAGSGSFPILALAAARQLGHEVTVLAIRDEAGPEIGPAAAGIPGVRVEWIGLGEVGRAIAILREGGVERAVMAGRVAHARLFGDLRPDPLLAAALSRLEAKNTDALILAIVKVFAEHGIELFDSTALLRPLLAPAGPISRRSPDDRELADIEFGCRMADAIAALDIGQTVAVKDRAVVAVEAMDGTDETIRRAGRIAGPGVAVVKVAKPNQDMRFDVPIVGLATIESMIEARSSALSIEAGRTLVFDRDEMVRRADQAGIAIVGRPRGPRAPAGGSPQPGRTPQPGR